MPYLCDSDGENPAAMLITNLDDGQVIALCGICFPQWVQAMAVAFTPEPEPVDPDTDEPTDEPTDQAAATSDFPAPVVAQDGSGPDLGVIPAENGNGGPKSVARHAARKGSTPDPEGTPAAAADQR